MKLVLGVLSAASLIGGAVHLARSIAEARARERVQNAVTDVFLEASLPDFFKDTAAERLAVGSRRRVFDERASSLYHRQKGVSYAAIVGPPSYKDSRVTEYGYFVGVHMLAPPEVRQSDAFRTAAVIMTNGLNALRLNRKKIRVTLSGIDMDVAPITDSTAVMTGVQQRWEWVVRAKSAGQHYLVLQIDSLPSATFEVAPWYATEWGDAALPHTFTQRMALPISVVPDVGISPRTQLLLGAAWAVFTWVLAYPIVVTLLARRTNLTTPK